MRRTVVSLAVAVVALATGVTAQCSAERPTPICAFWVEPYSYNEYIWGDVCGIPEPAGGPGTLMAEDVEFYDRDYGCDSNAGYNLVCCGLATACAVYEDCDGPATPLPGPGTSPALATGWSVDMLCAVDNAARVLANSIVAYQPGNTPYNCTTLCGTKNYEYAGVEYGDECYCGTGYVDGVMPPAADLSECGMLCSGNMFAACGGSWRMQIYKRDS